MPEGEGALPLQARLISRKEGHKAEAVEAKAGLLRRPGWGARSSAFVAAISNFMFESNHFLDLANQRSFFPPGQTTFILFSSP